MLCRCRRRRHRTMTCQCDLVGMFAKGMMALVPLGRGLRTNRVVQQKQLREFSSHLEFFGVDQGSNVVFACETLHAKRHSFPDFCVDSL